MKVTRRLRNAIIHKLGGITYDDIGGEVGAIRNYWKHEPVYTRIYVSKENYDENFRDSIEKEVAHKLAEVMLDMGCISFMNHNVSHGDVEIMGQAHILRLKRPMPYHMPSHLEFDEKEKTNENS